MVTEYGNREKVRQTDRQRDRDFEYISSEL